MGALGGEEACGRSGGLWEVRRPVRMACVMSCGRHPCARLSSAGGSAVRHLYHGGLQRSERNAPLASLPQAQGA